MSYSVAPGTFESLTSKWSEILAQCPSNSLFLTLPWKRLWWQYFSDDYLPLLLSIAHDGRPVGIAPLIVRGSEIFFLGSTTVCDYQDFILSDEHSYGGISAVLDHLEDTTWNSLTLFSVPSGSPTLTTLPKLAAERGYDLSIEQEDVCPQAELSADWEGYLGLLSKKDRHELRRKLRRLEQSGQVRFYASDDLDQDLEGFFQLHRASRDEKAAFMTDEMAAFFRSAVADLAKEDIPRLFFLEVEGVRAAAALCFDYHNQRLLYNSGYDHNYASLSVGLLLKAHILKDALEGGMRKFNFLRGNEPYKYDLGGVDYPIYTCVMRRRD